MASTPSHNNNNNIYTATTTSTTSFSSSSKNGSMNNNRVGPRAKCDQVVYEAIANAAEIIVRSRRSHIPPSSSSSSNSANTATATTATTTAGGYHFSSTSSSSSSRPHRSSNYGGSGSIGAGSSRFKLEVEEVEEVRAILQRWRRSLHVPLRLDVYYQNNNNSNENNPHQQEGQEEENSKPILLERWCIDYTASTTASNDTSYTSNDDTIVQLRQVCKRVVVLLRTLHCLTRMMPAFQLHRYLMETSSNLAASSYGGYYAADGSNQINVPGSNNMMMNDNGGVINFSFYVSTGHDDDETSLFSSFAPSSSGGGGSNSGNKIPFAKHVMSPVPTPYGKLHVTGLYDSALGVDKLLQLYHHHHQAVYPIQTRGMPIPIQHHNTATTSAQQTQQPMNQYQGGPPYSIDNQQQQPHSYTGNNMLIPPIRPSSLPATSTMNSYSSSPHSKLSANNSPHSPMVSPFIIQNYTDNASPHNSPQIQPLQDGNCSRILKKAHSAVTAEEIKQQQSFEMRHQGEDENGGGGGGGGLGNNSNGGKRVLSGLSLALMNEDMKPKNEDATSGAATPPLDQYQQQQQQQQHTTNITSSPHSSSGRKGCIDEATVLRHRLALHHPPPLTSHQQQQHQQQASSSSPKRYLSDNMNGGNYHSGEYGYGYNNGNTHFKQNQAAVENTVTTGYSNNNNYDGGGLFGTSPSPMISTPPQPMFLATTGGGDKGASGGNNGGVYAANNTAAVVPPFRSNPLTLQPYPSSSPHDYNTSLSMKKMTRSQDGSGTKRQQQNDASGDTAPSLLLPPVTSLDLLQKSPFKHPNQVGDNASLLSSLSFGGAAASAAYSAAAIGVDETTAVGGAGGSAFGGNIGTVPGSELLLRNSSALGSLNHGVGIDGNIAFDNYNNKIAAEPSTSFEDMPFAVDMSPSSSGGFLTSGYFTTGSGGPGGANNINNDSTASGGVGVGGSASSSLAVTSLAHRCATASRLKFFEMENDSSRVGGGGGESNVGSHPPPHSCNSENEGTNGVSLLADQLAEFRSFGASLSIGGANSAAASFATAPSAAAPISDVKSGSSAVEAGA